MMFNNSHMFHMLKPQADWSLEPFAVDLQSHGAYAACSDGAQRQRQKLRATSRLTWLSCFLGEFLFSHLINHHDMGLFIFPRCQTSKSKLLDFRVLSCTDRGLNGTRGRMPASRRKPFWRQERHPDLELGKVNKNPPRWTFHMS